MLLMEGGAANYLLGWVEKIKANNNFTVLTSCPATELITDKDGGVIGVMAQKADGTPVQVNAAYTILATGTLINDPEMVAKYAPQFTDVTYNYFGADGRVGDGHKMAEAVGARIDPILVFDSEAGYTGGKHGYDRDFSGVNAVGNAFIKIPYLWVNSYGRRFMDETAKPENQSTTLPQMFFLGNAMMQQGGVYWSIFDETIKNDLQSGKGIPVDNTWAGLIKGEKLDLADEAFEKLNQGGWAYKADTIADLAKQMGADPATLEATIKRNNELAAKRHDDDLLKETEFLVALSNPPFYAVKAVLTGNSFNGGLQCTPDFQVIRKDLSPINGLYVTGTLIGMMAGDTYPMAIAAGGGAGFSSSASRLIV
jgi:fumarate reductase flavoprotein subunit